jgi:hypothetical protein
MQAGSEQWTKRKLIYSVYKQKKPRKCLINKGQSGASLWKVGWGGIDLHAKDFRGVRDGMRVLLPYHSCNLLLLTDNVVGLVSFRERERYHQSTKELIIQSNRTKSPSWIAHGRCCLASVFSLLWPKINN